MIRCNANFFISQSYIHGRLGGEMQLFGIEINLQVLHFQWDIANFLVKILLFKPKLYKQLILLLTK
jgi:hypothetical protein